jgi:hypothetical protein
MPFSNHFYSPEQLKLMSAPLDAACLVDGPVGDGRRVAMAGRIMAAFDAGVTDPDLLRLTALGRR